MDMLMQQWTALGTINTCCYAPSPMQLLCPESNHNTLSGQTPRYTRTVGWPCALPGFIPASDMRHTQHHCAGASSPSNITATRQQALPLDTNMDSDEPLAAAPACAAGSNIRHCCGAATPPPLNNQACRCFALAGAAQCRAVHQGHHLYRASCLKLVAISVSHLQARTHWAHTSKEGGVVSSACQPRLTSTSSTPPAPGDWGTWATAVSRRSLPQTHTCPLCCQLLSLLHPVCQHTLHCSNFLLARRLAHSGGIGQRQSTCVYVLTHKW